MGNFWNKIKEIFEYSSTHGLNLPSAFDNRTGIGSVSLLFAHVANAVAIGGIVSLLFKDLKAGVYCAMGYSSLMLIFYLMRSIGKVKVDIDDGQIELEDNESKDGKNN